MLTRALVFSFVLVFVFASVPPKQFDSDVEQFAAWMIKHKKVYDTAEEHGLRFANFKASVKRIYGLNARSKNATFALNKFSDLSTDEFRAKYLMKEKLPAVTRTHVGLNNLLKPKVKDVPVQFDWRTMNVVTPVKDQQQCGSCWAFSVTENIESAWMLANKIQVPQMKPLAPQQIVDCDTTDGGCNGGFPASAYQYVQNAGGLEPEADYPYKGVDQSCNFQKPDVLAKISGFKYATTQGDEKTLQQNLVGNAPLSICVDAANWQDYSSGVMTSWDCCWFCQLDHCVQLVGYDSTSSTPYYMVRNSWNTDWGINGYIWLEMGKNTCGITDYATTSVAAV